LKTLHRFFKTLLNLASPSLVVVANNSIFPQNGGQPGDNTSHSAPVGTYSRAFNPSVIAQKNSGFHTSIADGFLMNG